MFLSSLGAKSCLGSFLEFLEPSGYFSNIKNDLSLFWNYFNFKNGFITKNKISSNPSNIYGWNTIAESFPNLETVSQDWIHNSRNSSPKFRAVPTSTTTPASNYVQFVRRWWNPRVLLLLSHWELRPDAFDSSIHLQFAINRWFSSQLRRTPSSPISYLHCSSCFFFVVRRVKQTNPIHVAPRPLPSPRSPSLSPSLFPSLPSPPLPTARWRQPASRPRPLPPPT